MASIKPRRWSIPTMDEVRASEAAARLSVAQMAAGASPAGRADVGGAACRADAPPSVTRGEHAQVVELVMIGGQVKQLMKRTGPDGGQAFLDWINFTCHEDTAHHVGFPGSTISDSDIINAMSFALFEIFGFGVTVQYEKGRNFYKRSYALGEEGCGSLSHGGQRNTVMISLTGTGLAAARPGWEYRLRSFLEETAINGRLTRVDVAYDCFNGEYCPKEASIDYDNGLFRLSRSPVNPSWEGRGNWKLDNDPKGLTAYIGVRTSGKFCRIYEKGKQLGAPDSIWNRVEVEFKSVDRVIPFDVLTAPGAYLAGSYPAFDHLNEKQDRIRTVRETKVCEKQRKEDWITSVCGADLHVLVELEEGATPQEQAFNLINRLKDESRLPKWAKLPDFRFSPDPIHMSSMLACVSDADIFSRLETIEV